VTKVRNRVQPGTKRKYVIRAGSAVHGIRSRALLACQSLPAGTDQVQAAGRRFELGWTQLWGLQRASVRAAMQSLSQLNRWQLPGNPANPVPGFEGPATIVRFTKNHKQPTGFRTAVAGVEPIKGHLLNVTYRGRTACTWAVSNINQAPNPVTPQSADCMTRG